MKNNKKGKMIIMKIKIKTNLINKYFGDIANKETIEWKGLGSKTEERIGCYWILPKKGVK